MYKTKTLRLRRALWRLVLGVGLLGLSGFFVWAGLVTLAMANYASWGPQTFLRGLQAIKVAVLGGLLYGPRMALRCWYLSAPLLALTAYAWWQLRLIERERRRAGEP